jgi:hypothetical protein
MSQEETCEIVQILKEAKITKDWDLVDEALIYLTNYCTEEEDEDEEEE